MALWLYLHFPALQLDSLYQENDKASKEQGPCVVVVEGRRNQVVQASAAAYACGIKLGMGLASAATLNNAIQVLSYNAQHECEQLKNIAQALYRVSADISLFEPAGLALKASNMLQLYQGLAPYWQAVQAQLAQQPCRYHFASAYSAQAARLLAQQQHDHLSDSPKQILEAIKRIPLSATDLSAKQQEQLTRVGVQSLAQLLNLDSRELSTRFDANLVSYLGKLKGEIEQPLSFYHPPERFARSLELLFEVSNLKLLDKALLRLLAQLHQFLQTRSHFAQELELELHLRPDTGTSTGTSKAQANPILHIGSAEGEDQSEAWLKLIQLQLERLRVKRPVTKLSLRLLRSEAKTGDMHDLFSGRQGQQSPLALLSQLQAKLGREAVKGLSLSEDPRPHLSSQLCEPSPQTGNKITAQIPPDEQRLRPSILLPCPKPLRERVSLVQGPERIATGWWDQQAIVRDYFIARAANGSWLWVYRTPEQKWYLHGVFS